ncbi:hypothetical protein [Aliarcobacter butzleri]|uniref:hypothetical protein n=1 Tax=Aliarcobacter butzleri TaxID=28197 RepID=UPI001260BC61|nr:hypothetical protein [Aliarcobacter butzleri]
MIQIIIGTIALVILYNFFGIYYNFIFSFDLRYGHKVSFIIFGFPLLLGIVSYLGILLLSFLKRI